MTAAQLFSATGDADPTAWAVFSPCESYRYSLGRVWDPRLQRLAFCGLNPSTADAEQLDPTLRRVVDYAKRWGYGSLEVVNLYALRATDPRALLQAPDPVGPDNDWYIRRAVIRADDVFIGWGAHPAAAIREERVHQRIGWHSLFCIGRTKAGHPVHPLYQPKDAQRVKW